MSDLKDKAINGFMWTTIGTVLTSIIGPLVLVVQARFLSPEEFGVLSIVNVVLTIINVIENFGFSTAIIQRDNVNDEEKSSLFFFQVLFTALIGIIVLLVAPLFANLFDMPPLRELLPLLSIIIFLNAPVILFAAFLEKDFHFKELSIVRMIRQVVLFAATFLFLFLEFGLTGVVLGQITSVLTMVTLTLGLAYKHEMLNIKLHFKFSEVRPFIKFGLYITGKQLMTQFVHHMDELIIGYFLPASVLGLYYFAKNLLNRLRTLITTSFAKVLLPLMSRVKNDRTRLTNIYNKISKYVGIFAFPVFVGVAVTANLFIPAFFGEEWLGSIEFFIILSIAYIPNLLTANLATSLLYSVNKPDVVLYTDLIANSIYVLLLLIVSWMGLGIYSIVGLYAIYLVAKTGMLQYLTQLQLHSHFIQYLTLFKYSVISTVLMSISVLGFNKLLFNEDNHLIFLVASILIGGSTYFISYYILDKRTLFEMKDLMINRKD